MSKKRTDPLGIFFAVAMSLLLLIFLWDFFYIAPKRKVAQDKARVEQMNKNKWSDEALRRWGSTPSYGGQASKNDPCHDEYYRGKNDGYELGYNEAIAEMQTAKEKP